MRRLTKEINNSAKERSEIRRLLRRVSQVNSKTVKHDARKIVFIHVGAERDAIIPLKLRTANNAGRCVAFYVINALNANACVRAAYCIRVDGKREMIFKRCILSASVVGLRAQKNTFV